METQVPHEAARRERGRGRKPWLDLLLLAVIILATWLPRGLALDRFVTPDEELWLYRSANFYYALTHLDFASTYQKEHPGVTVMWAGTAGFLSRFPGYRGSGQGQTTARQLQNYLVQKADVPPLELLAAGRSMLVLAHTLILALSFWLARRSIGLWPAFAGFLLLAFDPFHLALTRILHLDGLLTNLLLLSLLAFLSYLQERKMLYLLLSGAAAGLSWLTKSPGFVLVPVVSLLAFWDFWRRIPVGADGMHPDGIRLGGLTAHSIRAQAIRAHTMRPYRALIPRGFWHTTGLLALWCSIGVLVFVCLWPAMWKVPGYVFSQVFGEALGYAEAGHVSPVFFNGTLTPDGDLGLKFFYFYPLVYLWRSTPVILLGLVAALAGYLRKEGPFDPEPRRRAATGLLLMAVAFTFLITLSGKKFDRYLIPAFAPLDLLAGMGWVWVVQKAAVIWNPTRRISFPRLNWIGTAIAVLAIAVQIASALSTFPYYFSYYNPIMGGSRKAAEVMQIGWGEGLDQAAHYLDQKPDAEKLKAISWYSTSSFGYLSKTRARFLGPKGDWTDEDRKLFNTSDYAVVYIHQWQRGMPAEVLAQLAKMKPEHSIWINGIEYVQIYRLH
jgi:hypothetical protein